MANVLVNETYLEDIADAIRGKNGTQNTYKPGQMADAIDAISGGGAPESGTFTLSSGTPITFTLPVTKKCSKLFVWADGINRDTDISEKPYPAYTILGIEVNNDTGIVTFWQISSMQTTFVAYFSKIEGWPNQTAGGNDKVVFNDDNIVVTNLRSNGANRPMIANHLYHWEAW